MADVPLAAVGRGTVSLRPHPRLPDSDGDLVSVWPPRLKIQIRHIGLFSSSGALCVDAGILHASPDDASSTTHHKGSAERTRTVHRRAQRVDSYPEPECCTMCDDRQRGSPVLPAFTSLRVQHSSSQVRKTQGGREKRDEGQVEVCGRFAIGAAPL